MRIVYLAAGAGGMYCGMCLSSNALVAAMRRLGADAMLLPAYTPLRTDEDDVSLPQMAFGGLNVFLQEKSALFRHTPRLLDWLLDRPGLLRLVGRLSTSTRPQDLGPLTVSMLRGEQGRQRKELVKLVELLEELRPDVIHLSTVLLAGVAGELVRRLGVPVVATLAGEELFVDRLPSPHREAARAELRRHAAELTAMVAMNRFTADFMADYLNVARERIEVIPAGIQFEGFPHDATIPAAGSRGTPFTLGYFARIAPEKGLHVAAEALKHLAAEATLPPVRLRAGGYLGRAEGPYLEAITGELAGLTDRFEYAGEVDRPGKIALLASFDVMALPTTHPESKGLPVLEAWAAGTPVIVPATGTFPEMIDSCGGGLLVPPDDPVALAAAVRRLVADRRLAAELGRQGRAALERHHGVELAAERTVALYERLR